MIFNLDTVGIIYSKEEAKKLEKLGFDFTPDVNNSAFLRKIASDLKVEINSIEDLMKFVKEYGLITMDEDQIRIYDDYRE